MHMKKKSLFLLCLITTISLLFSACGNSTDISNTQTESSSESESIQSETSESTEQTEESEVMLAVADKTVTTYRMYAVTADGEQKAGNAGH